MGEMRAKVAYLQGLAEGLDLEHSSAEGRMLNAMLGVMHEMAEAMEAVVTDQTELHEYLEDVDHDLGALEEEIYLVDEEDDPFGEVEETPIISHEDGMTVISCPECGETLGAGFGEGMEHLEATCPACGTGVEFTTEEEIHP